MGSVHRAVIQIDSGMSRLGLSPREVAQPSAALGRRMHGIDVRLVMSHLACAATIGHEANAYQRTMFQSLAGDFAGIPRSLANSSGIFLGEDFHYDVVWPRRFTASIPRRRSPTGCGQLAQIVQVREIEAGDHVGYGWDFHAKRPARMATLSIGYADSLHRTQGQAGVVYLEGRALRIVGRVAMDSITVDLDDLPAESLAPDADDIELIGPHQSVDGLANASSTIGYEILTGIGRYLRIYRGITDGPQGSEPLGDMLQ
jgi:alanine racemase